MEKKLQLLAIDDNKRVLETIELEIGDEVDVTSVTDAEEALNLLVRKDFDIVLSDYDLKHDSITGLNIFKRAINKNPFVTAALMTGTNHGSLIKEVFNIYNGYFLEKPFREGALQELLKRAQLNVTRKMETLGDRDPDDLFRDLVADTPSMAKLVAQLKKCAKDETLRIHLAGPTGTGKSTYVEVIHKISNVKGKLVTVNCAGLEELAMSRLFGHVKGSFTGANNDHVGYIQEANGGTLFLDEFHLLGSEVQGKLLQVLHDGKFRKFGGKIDETSAFRLITAASVDVMLLAEQKQFSPDLWFRAAAKVIVVPSLSERKACLPKLIYRKLAELEKKIGHKIEIANPALDLLINFSWAGNIRDLHNCLTSVCSELEPGQIISVDMIKDDLRHRSGSSGNPEVKFMEGETFNEALNRFQSSMISNALHKHKGSMTRAAKALGMPRTSLITKCESLKLSSATS
jgi:two-component system response regulator GlrR